MPPSEAGANKRSANNKSSSTGPRGEAAKAPVREREVPSKPGAGFAWLLWPHPGRLRFTLIGRGGAIGRDPDIAIPIDGPGIAPLHAHVELLARAGVDEPTSASPDDLEIYITDAGAPAGLYVGGMRAQRTVLHEGDVLRVGGALALVAERDIATYDGNVIDEAGIVRGPRSRKGWFSGVEKTLAEANVAHRRVLVDGPKGAGRTTVLRAIAAAWGGLELVEVDASRADFDPSAVYRADGRLVAVAGLGRLDERALRSLVDALAKPLASSGVAIVVDSDAERDAVLHALPSFSTAHRVSIPSLENRREEVPMIVRSRFDKRGISGHKLSIELYETLTRAAWPGEIAELCEVVDQIAAAHADEARLGPEHLVRPLARRGGRFQAPIAADAAVLGEADRIRQALAQSHGSVAAAARTLHLSRQALYREAARLGIDIRRTRDGDEGPESAG